MQNRIVPQAWMLLDKELRDYLAQIFHIEISGIIEIRDQTVVTDGRTMNDLAVITIERMEHFAGEIEGVSEEDKFARLWNLVISKAKYELHPPIDISPKDDVLSDDNLKKPNDTEKK